MNKEQLKLKYPTERVLCVNNSSLESWETQNENKVLALLNAIRFGGYMAYRYDAELNFDAKQVIPYVVLKHEDKYFVTKRIKGDERLVGGLSIAVGGHINPVDRVGTFDPEKVVLNCIDRELDEETTVIKDDIKSMKFVTSFVDESSEVSRVHVCLLTLIELNNNAIGIKETDKLEGVWMSVDEIKEQYEKLEGWSKITFDLLEKEGA